MDDSQDKPDYFQYRWGVKEWDVGFTTIPNPVLKYYARVPWKDKAGKCGHGISNQEMLCIIHLASFHFESEEGESRPAIGTVARRMGYRKDDSVRGLIKSLEHKNLLTVERRPGKCSIYDLSNFSRAILELEGEQPPHPNGGPHPNGSLSNGDHSNGPHPQGDEEKKFLEERKQEGKEEKEKKEGDSAFPEKAQPGPAPAAREERDDDEVEVDDPDNIGRDGMVHPGDKRLADAGGPAVECADRRGAGVGDMADPIVESIADDFLNKPSPEDLQCATATARAASGGNYAAPPPAGGDDAVAFAALKALYGGEPPKPESGIYRMAMEKLGLVLAQRGVRDIEVGRKAGELMREANRKNPAFLNPALKTFESAFDVFVAEAQRGAKQCAKPPPGGYEPVYGSDPEPLVRDDGDCPLGVAIKGEIQLQMDRPTFDTYVKLTTFVCDDGVLIITAPDETVKGWLENRLATTIRRTAVGVVGGAVEVVFEAGGPEEAVA